MVTPPTDTGFPGSKNSRAVPREIALAFTPALVRPLGDEGSFQLGKDANYLPHGSWPVGVEVSIASVSD